LALQGSALNIRDVVSLTDTENCQIRMSVFQVAWDMYGNDIQIHYEETHRDDPAAIWPYQEVMASGERRYFAHQENTECFKKNVCEMEEMRFQAFTCDLETMTKETATLEKL